MRGLSVAKVGPSSSRLVKDAQRRYARLSAIPLAAIVLTFFLPTFDACFMPESPAALVVETVDSPWMWWWLYPYLAAAFLLVMTAIWYSRTPTPRSHRIVLGGLSPGLASPVFPVALMIFADLEPEGWALAWTVVSGVLLAVAVALALHGRRVDSWRRWMTHLAVYASLSFSYVAWLVLGWWVFGDKDELLVGGYLFIGAWLLLAGACVYAGAFELAERAAESSPRIRRAFSRLGDRSRWPRRWWWPLPQYLHFDGTSAWERQHDETSRTLRRTTMVLVAFSVFCALTLGQPETIYLDDRAAVPLPFANLDVLFRAFLVIALVMILGVTSYLHVFLAYRHRLGAADRASRLPFFFNLDLPVASFASRLLLYWLTPAVLAGIAWHCRPRPEGPLLVVLAGAVTATSILLQLRRDEVGSRDFRCLFLWPSLGVVLAATALVLTVNRRVELPPGEELVGVSLQRWNLSGWRLEGVNLSEANLLESNLSEASLWRANLADANLWGANLWSADLVGANLAEAYLRSANLERASLSGANLAGASLWWANLVKANLVGADLRKTNLDSVDLSMASLIRADLSMASLTWADLRDADLTGANLTAADLREVKSLTQAQLDRACAHPERPPRLPEGLSAPPPCPSEPGAGE